MALKVIAVQGATLAHGAGSPVTGGVFTITSTPSLKCKAESKGMYKSPLSFTFTGGTYSGGLPGTAQGSGTINATATKDKADGSLVMRVDDSGTMSGTYDMTNPSPPPPTIPVPFSGAPVKISDANQTKVVGQ